jgi:hypothetical protein
MPHAQPFHGGLRFSFSGAASNLWPLPAARALRLHNPTNVLSPKFIYFLEIRRWGSTACGSLYLEGRRWLPVEAARALPRPCDSWFACWLLPA